MAKVAFEPLKPLIGARVQVAKADLLDPEVAAACNAALEERGVLVFPELGLSDAEQLAFTDALGPRANFTQKAPGGRAGDDVYKITLDEDANDHPEYVLGTFFWHVDGATMDQPLPKATLLSGRKVTARGGQTEFANLYAAYEALPDEAKAEYGRMRALHTLTAAMRPVVEAVNPETVVLLGTATDMVHPLVWTHKSGRKSLLIGTQADRIVDLPLAYGRAILARLMEWAARPEFTYSHSWRQGDFVIWDNCGVMHRVVPYDAHSGRMMHRTSIAGVEKVA